MTVRHLVAVGQLAGWVGLSALVVNPAYAKIDILPTPPLISGPHTIPACVALYIGLRGHGKPTAIEVVIRDAAGATVGLQTCTSVAVGHSCIAHGPINSGPVQCAVSVHRTHRVMRVSLILLNEAGHSKAVVAYHNEK